MIMAPGKPRGREINNTYHTVIVHYKSHVNFELSVFIRINVFESIVLSDILARRV